MHQLSVAANNTTHDSFLAVLLPFEPQCLIFPSTHAFKPCQKIMFTIYFLFARHYSKMPLTNLFFFFRFIVSIFLGITVCPYPSALLFSLQTFFFFSHSKSQGSLLVLSRSVCFPCFFLKSSTSHTLLLSLFLITYL